MKKHTFRKEKPEAGDADPAFRELFETVLKPAIPALLRKRRACLLWAGAAAAAVFAVSLAMFSHFYWLFATPGEGAGERNWFAIVLFALAMACAALYFVSKFLIRGAVADFRDNLLKPIARFVDPALDFVPDRHILALDFEKSLLFDTVADGRSRFSGAGLFSGRWEKRGFEFSALKAERMVRHGCRVRRSRIFGGLFLVIDLGRNRPGLTMAIPKAAGLEVEELEPRLSEIELAVPKRVKSTGHHEFDRLFDAYAPEAVEAAGFFTPELTRLVAEAYNKYGAWPYLSRVGDKLYFALLTGRRHFELPEAGEALDFAKCCEYRDDMRLCLSLAGNPALNAPSGSG